MSEKSINSKSIIWMVPIGITVMGWAFSHLYSTIIGDIKAVEVKVHAINVKLHVLEEQIKQFKGRSR